MARAACIEQNASNAFGRMASGSHPMVVKLEQFAHLSQADRNALREITSRRRDFAALEDIAREGDRTGPIRIILAGWACRYKQLKDGQRQIIAIFLPGDLCDAHIHAPTVMDHSIGALTSVTLAEIEPDQLASVIARHPRIELALWREMQAAASIQREWTVNLGRRDAPQRIGHFFCELHERLRNIGLTQGDNCELPLGQARLADAMGLTNVHVNRSLKILRAKGLIVLKSGRLTILDAYKLRRFSLFEPGYLNLFEVGANDDVTPNDFPS